MSDDKKKFRVVNGKGQLHSVVDTEGEAKAMVSKLNKVNSSEGADYIPIEKLF
jgi:hypothetical protein